MAITPRFILLILACTMCLSCAKKQYDKPHIAIETQFGDIELELYDKQAPKTVAAFLSYLDSGYYNRSSFYRVLRPDNQTINSWKAEFVQGGLWRSNYARANALPGIPHETTQQTGILHKNGIISMARNEPGTATTEFFIMIGDQPGFDFGGENNKDGLGYAAFGKVVNGWDILNKLYNQPERNTAFDPAVHIFNIKKL